VSDTDEDKPVALDNFFKIVMVLDESGSMSSIKTNMIKSINDLITEQKQVKERQATFTLVKFNDRINRVIKNKHLNNIRKLSENDYQPNATTALYDAIGDTINWFRNERDVLMVIVTDGQENSSRRYNKTMVTNMIEDKKRFNNWSYVYLSNDLDTFAQGDNIGLHKSKFASNCLKDKYEYSQFLSKDLNGAIKNYRQYNMSVQDQLNK